MKIKIDKGTINTAILNSVWKKGNEDYERQMNNHELYRKFQIADILVQAEQRYHDRMIATIEMEQNPSSFIIDFCAAYNLQ